MKILVALSFSTVSRNSFSSVQLSSQTWNCSTSIVSCLSFWRIISAYFKTWSAGKTSEYLFLPEAGHLRFFGGIFDAAKSRLPAFRLMVSPSRLSLFALPVRPGGIEKVAAQVHGELQGLDRFLIGGAAPAAHSP